MLLRTKVEAGTPSEEAKIPAEKKGVRNQANIPMTTSTVQIVRNAFINILLLSGE